MSPTNIMRYLMVLLLLSNCLLPILARHHKKKHRKRLNRSPENHESTEQRHGQEQGAPKIKITVNRTVINITTTSNDKGKQILSLPSHIGKENHDPQLKSVNTLDGTEHSHVSNASLNVQVHRNLSPQPVEKTVSYHSSEEKKLLDTEVFKSLLRDLLMRLDKYDSSQMEKSFPVPVSSNTAANNQLSPLFGEEGPRHINPNNVRHCTLHGLWLSTVAGAAIELIPEQQEAHVEIHTKIFELPDNPYPPLINSQWTGKGIISQESPTTLTIVFQEHINTEKENHAKERGLEDGDNKDDSPVDIQLPRTAVFVGQCLVCQGNPTLQGAWVVFPASQTCSAGAGFIHGKEEADGSRTEQKRDSIRMTTEDSIYLLRYY